MPMLKGLVICLRKESVSELLVSIEAQRRIFTVFTVSVFRENYGEGKWNLWQTQDNSIGQHLTKIAVEPRNLGQLQALNDSARSRVRRAQSEKCESAHQVE